MILPSGRKIEKCIVMVPHQDDETMLAGNTIIHLHNLGVEIYVLYSTNGDWKYPAEKRIDEAYHALNSLIPFQKDHILLLGYGDNFNDRNHTHFYYSPDGEVKYKSGHSRTYGVKGINDIAYMLKGEHGKYNRSSFVSDLQAAIEYIRADLIICIDFDEHPDHRMLTLGFDEAMCSVLKEKTDYHPLVLKGFAYSMAYTAIPDLYRKEFRYTEKPTQTTTKKYEYDFIGTTVYDWDDRISILAPQCSLSRNLLRNRKARALMKHKTQFVILRAESIINKDEVFWQRRTDSISYAASVYASSGNPEQVKDYRLYNVNEIDEKIPSFCDYLWQPEDEKKEITFEWDKPYDIQELRIYGNIDEDSQIKKIKVSFDNGYFFETGPLPLRGRPLSVRFDNRLKNVSKCVLKIEAYEGNRPGIAECEFYTDDNADVEELVSIINEHSVCEGDTDRKSDEYISKMYLFAVKVKRKIYRTLRKYMKK